MPEPLDRFARRAFHGHRTHYGEEPVVVASAPGRVNLIGEHLDYCGGRVLPLTIPNRTQVTLGPALGPCSRFFSSRIGSELEIDPAALVRQGDWADHLRGVLREYVDLGYEVPPVVGWVDGDVPLGSGLSSSAALSVAFATAVEALVGCSLGPPERARLCQRAENRTVGVACGLMDQMAVAVGEVGHALLMDCRTERTGAIPVRLPGAKLVLADSRVPRKLAASQYNERRQDCQDALRLLHETGWQLHDLRDVPAGRLGELEAVLGERRTRRVRHQVTENARVLEAVAALAVGDVEELGRLLDASHASLRDDFEVSHPDVDALLDLARAQPGVLGARMTGAGFGGYVVLLARDEAVRPLANALVAGYYEPNDRSPVVLEAGAGAGAARVEFPASNGADRAASSVG